VKTLSNHELQEIDGGRIETLSDVLLCAAGVAISFACWPVGVAFTVITWVLG